MSIENRVEQLEQAQMTICKTIELFAGKHDEHERRHNDLSAQVNRTIQISNDNFATLIDIQKQQGEQLKIQSAAQSQHSEHMRTMVEILQAWNNAKGFAATIKFISTAAKVIMPIIGIAGAIFIAYKTGVWPV